MQHYRIKILQKAKNDLKEMLEILSGYSGQSALRKYDKIKNGIEKLRDFPLMCEEYRPRKAYRRMVIEDYLVFYQVDEPKKLVLIYRVLYARRDTQKLIK